MKRTFKILSVLIAALLLVLLLSRINIDKLLVTLNLPFNLVLTLLLLQALTFLIISHQWHYLIGVSKYRVPFAKIVDITLLATLVESITPSVKAGGEGVRAYMFSKDLNIVFDKTTSIILMQKSLSFLTFLIFFALSLYSSNLTGVDINIHFIYLPIIAVIIFGAFFFGYKRFNKVKKFVSKIINNIKTLKSKKTLLYLLSSNTIMWLLYPVKVSLIVNHFGLDIGFLQIAIITFLSYGVSMLPTTPGSVGTFEGAMILGFLSLGATIEIATVLAIATRFFTFYVVVIVSAIYALFKKINESKLLFGGV